MYEDLLDAETKTLFRKASAQPDLSQEIRLLRARVARSAADQDHALFATSLDMLVKTALAQSRIGPANTGADELLSYLRRDALKDYLDPVQAVPVPVPER